MKESYASYDCMYERILKRICIAGLDPAGPFFNFLESHLSAEDARFVDTIHTDAGFYGIARASGSSVSFYPNGGRRVQPGCPTSYEFSSPEGKLLVY